MNNTIEPILLDILQSMKGYVLCNELFSIDVSLALLLKDCLNFGGSIVLLFSGFAVL